MAKYDDRQKVINRINARLKSYGLSSNEMSFVIDELTDIEGVYKVKDHNTISIDPEKWVIDSEFIEAALEKQVKTVKTLRAEAKAELEAKSTSGEEVTPEAIQARVEGHIYPEAALDEVKGKYYELMDNKEAINAAELKSDPLKKKIFDDMTEFGKLVRRKDTDALTYKSRIIDNLKKLEKKKKNKKGRGI